MLWQSLEWFHQLRTHEGRAQSTESSDSLLQRVVKQLNGWRDVCRLEPIQVPTPCLWELESFQDVIEDLPDPTPQQTREEYLDVVFTLNDGAGIDKKLWNAEYITSTYSAPADSCDADRGENKSSDTAPPSADGHPPHPGNAPSNDVDMDAEAAEPPGDVPEPMQLDPSGPVDDPVEKMDVEGSRGTDTRPVTPDQGGMTNDHRDPRPPGVSSPRPLQRASLPTPDRGSSVPPPCSDAASNGRRSGSPVPDSTASVPPPHPPAPSPSHDNGGKVELPGIDEAGQVRSDTEEVDPWMDITDDGARTPPASSALEETQNSPSANQPFDEARAHNEAQMDVPSVPLPPKRTSLVHRRFADISQEADSTDDGASQGSIFADHSEFAGAQGEEKSDVMEEGGQADELGQGPDAQADLVDARSHADEASEGAAVEREDDEDDAPLAKGRKRKVQRKRKRQSGMDAGDEADVVSRNKKVKGNRNLKEEDHTLVVRGRTPCAAPPTDSRGRCTETKDVRGASGWTVPVGSFPRRPAARVCPANQ